MTPKNGTQHHPARKFSIQTGSIPSELSISLYGGTDFLFNKLVFLVPVALPADCASGVQADEMGAEGRDAAGILGNSCLQFIGLVAMRLRKCYILSMSENTAYEQKDLNMVVSEPIRNPWVEMTLNAKAYFEAYRGLCRLRIEVARLYEDKAWSKVDWKPHEECKKRAEFWVRSGEYWKKKLEESFQREKDYMEGK